jgi:hypothetical protein
LYKVSHILPHALCQGISDFLIERPPNTIRKYTLLFISVYQPKVQFARCCGFLSGFTLMAESYIMWRVEPLKCDDRELSGYTRPVSGQRLDKHVPVVRQKILNNVTVGLQQ